MFKWGIQWGAIIKGFIKLLDDCCLALGGKFNEHVADNDCWFQLCDGDHRLETGVNI
jgi:hypothetical protein